jgi:hypothetical protein
MSTRCGHLGLVKDVEPRTPDGCEECLAMGSEWVHLRMCLECGHVGCCDQSRHKHATKHYHRSKHTMMKSFQPDEDWGWCYDDQMMFEPAPRPA